MIKVDQIVIVEGKYDKIKLSSIIDGIIIETEGFGIFKNKEKQKLIRKLAEKKGVVILTDSDSAGFVIRNFITSIVPNEYITNVYIPDIFGKEKRKTVPSKEGKLGVEGIDKEILLKAFEKAGILSSETPENRDPITKIDLFEAGLTGGQNSAEKRKEVLKKLDMPQLLTTNSMLEILNTMMSREEFMRFAAEIN